jgi:hypothetical protein
MYKILRRAVEGELYHFIVVLIIIVRLAIRGKLFNLIYLYLLSHVPNKQHIYIYISYSSLIIITHIFCFI